MIVSYESVEAFPGWDKAPELFKSLISRCHAKRILEVGSGANPTLSSDFVRDNQLTYVTSDVSLKELAKADPAFMPLVLDLSAESIDPSLSENFDCVISRMVGEHVSNGALYHRNIYKVLRPGGISVHCFSTLWALPFAVNRLLPEFITSRLLNNFAPRDNDRHGKFRAYYSWSRGPSEKMIRQYKALGYEIIRYTGYFGHGYYSHRLRWLHRLEGRKARFLLKHPVPQLCSYATLILRKPLTASTPQAGPIATNYEEQSCSAAS
jgi:SAM-dependent methyltransferase